MVRIVVLLVAATVFAFSGAGAGELPSRHFDEYCWAEFGSYVPERVSTVILPVGTIEAHGALANNADGVVPERLAEMIAPRVNALIAPLIPYGRTASLAPYPGCFGISEATFENYCREVIAGLAKVGFRNIIVLNGHGPNRKPLDRCALKVAGETEARILVVDWWSYCSDVTQEVFGQDGGHAGLNETAAVQAVNEKLVKKNLYDKDLVTVIDRSYTAVPFPSAIGLYKEGEGYPDFDRVKAAKYLGAVADKLTELVEETVAKWDKAGL